MQRTRLTAVLLVAIALLGGTLLAQDDPAYTRSELWEVSRQNWKRFVADFEKNDKPALEQMFAEGKISEWGIESYTLHLPGEFTHGYFYTASGMKNLGAAGQAWLEALEGKGYSEHEFAPLVVSHRDQIFRNVRMRARGGTYKNAFSAFTEFHVEPGQGGAYMELWEERIQPRMEKLLTDGKIIGYGLLAEEIQTREGTWRATWYIAASAEGYDEANRSFRASWDSMSGDERQALLERWRSIVQEETLREGLSTLLYYQVKDF